MFNATYTFDFITFIRIAKKLGALTVKIARPVGDVDYIEAVGPRATVRTVEYPLLSQGRGEVIFPIKEFEKAVRAMEGLIVKVLDDAIEDRSGFRVKLDQADDSLEPHSGERTLYCMVPGVIEMLPHLAKAMSSDKSRDYINGILASEGRLVATDGHRLLATAPMGHEFASDDRGNIIPAPAVEAFALAAKVKGFEDPSLLIGEDVIGFAFEINGGKYEILSKKPPAEFPDWKGIVPKSPSGHLAVEVKAAVKALRRIAKISDAKAVCKVTPVDDVLMLETHKASAKVEASVGWGASEVEAFGVNPAYLADALETSSDGILLVSGALSPIEVPVSGLVEGGVWLVMPMRLDD
jgi:DNA polymerase III sliding clamp (beta) subunit (PCNA family)